MGIIARGRWMILLFLLPTIVSAQGIDAGIGVGAMGYYGDLDRGKFFKSALAVNLAAEAEVSVIWNRWLQTTLSFTYGNVEGADSLKHVEDPLFDRNLSFTSSVMELGLTAEYHFLGNADLEDPLFFSPYAVLGISGFSYNPRVPLNGFMWEARAFGTEGQGAEGYDEPYGKYSLAIPFGLGVKIKLPYPYALKFDIIGRYAFTGYLDDVHKDYVPYDVLFDTNQSPVSPMLSDKREPPSYTGQRGNGKNDVYFTYLLTFVYNLKSDGRNGVYCPTVEKPIF